MRVLTIVRSATHGNRFVPLSSVHALAYFADVLAPVWRLSAIEPRILKQSGQWKSTVIQRALDRLVGMGLLGIHDVSYRREGENYLLDAAYSINQVLASSVFEALERWPRTRRETAYVDELCLALTSMGDEVLWQAASADATYGDENVDVGALVNVALRDGGPTRTVQYAEMFRELTASATHLSAAEIVNLYVRHVYSALAQMKAADA